MNAPARQTEIVWAPQRGPQKQLVDCPYREIFFGGARGGGKTDAVLGKWALREQQLGSTFNAVGVRPTARSWDDAIERSKQIFGQIGGRYNETKMTWRMPNGGRAQFGYLESVSDADQYQGKNVTDVWVEEVGLYATTVGAKFLPRPIARLKAVMRSRIGVKTQMVLTGNPGGPGQHWVSSRYGMIPFPDGVKVVEVESEAGEKTEAAVIPSRVSDNRMIDQVEYVSSLRQSGSAALVSAWLSGDWSAVEGAFFDCWDEARHVVTPFSIPAHWLRFVSMDWGFASPFSVGWWAVASDPVISGRDDGDARVDGGAIEIETGTKRRITIPRGCLIRYREWYGTGGARLTAEEVAAGILEREFAAGEKRDEESIIGHDRAAIGYGVLDPSAFAADGGPSIAERMARSGVWFKPADNRRVRVGGAISGWDQLRSRLVGDIDGNPMIVFFRDCVDTIRTIPVLQHDPDKPEDLETTGTEDHAADECFVAGTLVRCPCGDVAIETIQAGDLVATRHGWCAVEAAFSVGERDVFTVEISDGRSLTGTANHPVWTEGNGFLRLSALRYGDMLRTCPDIIPTLSGERRDACGESCMDPYRAIITSITLTEMIRTTIHPIWSAFLLASIAAIIWLCDLGLRWSARLAEEVTRRLLPFLVFVPMPVSPHGAAEAARIISTENARDVDRLSASADIARFVSVLTHAQSRGVMNEWWRIIDVWSVEKRSVPRIAEPNSARPHVVSVTPVGRQRVYNLTVADEPEYYAAGVLVHNCRYACMSRPWARELPTAPDRRILSVGPGNQVTLDDLWNDAKREDRI